jgi:hypothetical protein
MVDVDKKSILKVVNQDSLKIAEQCTGKSYKDDEETDKLGLGLHMMIADQKKKVLRQVDDTYFGIRYADYEDILFDMGMQRVLSYPTKRYDGRIDAVHVHASEDGLLVVSEEYNHHDGVIGINGGNIYFCLELDNPYENYEWEYGLKRSGSYDDIDGSVYMSGYLDVREALRTRIDTMRENGKFANPWKSMSTGPSFMTSQDWKKYKYNDPEYKSYKLSVFKDKFGQLPEWIQKMMDVYKKKEEECLGSNSDT